MADTEQLDPGVELMLKERFDGELFNAITNLGTRADPLEQTIFRPVLNTFNNLFWDMVVRRSRFADRIVSFYPNKMTQKWCKVTTGRDVEPDVAANLTLELRRQLRKRYRRAFREANINGAACILRLVNDGREAHEPIDYNNIREFGYSRIMNRWEIYPDLTNYGTDPKEPDFYLVSSTYAVDDQEKFLAYRWHRDRVIRFDGTELTEDGYRWSTGWGDSILTGIVDALKGYMLAIGYSVRSLKSFEVLHLATDLLEQAITNEENKLKFEGRWSTIQATMSVLNMIVTSRQNEEVSYLQRKYSGVAEMIEKARQYLVDVSGLTKVQLFGEHPTGSIGSTGESLTQDQALSVSEKQQNIFEDQLMIDLQVMMASRYGPTRGNTYDNVGLEWEPLFEASETEKADLRAKDANTIATLVGLKDALGKPIFLAGEIRNLYADDRYRSLGEIVLDPEQYDEEIAAIEEAQQAEGEFQFPPGVGGEEGAAEEQPASEAGAGLEDPLGQTDALECRQDGDWFHFTWAMPPNARMDAKECKEGISCGETCISAETTCQVEAGEESKGLLGKLFGEGRGKKAALAAGIALGIGVSAYAASQNPYLQQAGRDAQGFVGSMTLLYGRDVTDTSINKLPISKNFKQKIRNATGVIKAQAMKGVLAPEKPKLRSVTKDFVGFEMPGEGIDAPQFHSISHIGANPVVFSNMPDRRVGDRTLYNSTFSVNLNYAARGKQQLDRREQIQTLGRVRDMFQDQIQSLPDGTILRNEPFKEGGRDRARLYRRFGFNEIEGIPDTQFAVIQGGQARRPNESEIADIQRSFREAS